MQQPTSNYGAYPPANVYYVQPQPQYVPYSPGAAPVVVQAYAPPNPGYVPYGSALPAAAPAESAEQVKSSGDDLEPKCFRCFPHSCDDWISSGNGWFSAWTTPFGYVLFQTAFWGSFNVTFPETNNPHQGVCLALYILGFPIWLVFALIGFAFGLVGDILQILIWALSFGHCGKRCNCECQTERIKDRECLVVWGWSLLIALIVAMLALIIAACVLLAKGGGGGGCNIGGGNGGNCGSPALRRNHAFVGNCC